MIKILIIDVDGTMTDGGIYYDERGNELKKFNTRDAAGIFAAKKVGIEVLILTGRESSTTYKRMTELGVKRIYQNVKDKRSFIEDYMKQYNLKKDDVGYIGDDLNDYYSMLLAGFIACPKDACKEIITMADHVSTKKGGDGAVREIIEYYLDNLGLWESAVKDVYHIGC